MKWGVRKDRYVNSKQKAMIDHSKKNHPSIPKGTTVYRTTHGESDNLSSDIYVSWTDRDRNYYRKNWGTNLGEEVAMRKVINDGKNFKSYKYNEKDYTSYEQQYKLTEDLKVASYRDTCKAIQKARRSMSDKERYDMYRDIGEYATKSMLYENLYYGDSKRISSVNRNTKLKSEIIKDASNYGKQCYESWASKDRSKFKEGDINSWAWQIGASKTLRSKVTSELKKQGYNSCVDVAGVGTKRSPQGVDPLIVFNSSSLKKQSVTRYTEKDRKSLPDYNSYKDDSLATDWDKLDRSIKRIR